MKTSEKARQTRGQVVEKENGLAGQKHSATAGLKGNAVRCFDWLSNNQENQTGVWLVSDDQLMTCLAVCVFHGGMSTELERQAQKGPEGRGAGRRGTMRRERV